ncbi:hypothetical protein [Emticicia fluvialis]|uniref:hypothetical protein n=1 Tax=Emticicia fluvialis TaxID=2974474 RepID=UPI00216538FB|nr:hypothetical protein [Emticicia fluvialis]
MKRFLLTIIVVFLSLSINATDKRHSRYSEFEYIQDKRIEILRRAFERKDYLSFFKLFPNTFEEFFNFYGYDEKSGAKLLYGHDEHIEYLFANKGRINSEIFAAKIYGIAKDAIWNVDTVDLFQSYLSEMILNYPNLFLKILATKPDKEAAGFWRFVFDGSLNGNLTNQERFNITYKKIKQLDTRQAEILKQEFYKMYK